MKRYMKHIFNEWQRFLTLQRRFNSKVTFVMILKSVSLSLFYTVFIFLIPILLLVNLLIYDALKYIIIAMLIILVFVSIRVYYVFFIKSITQLNASLKALNLDFMFKVERLLVYSILIIFGLIILGALL